MNDIGLDTQLRLQDIRLRVMNRTPVTKDEYRSLLLDLRKDRENASRAGAAARKTAKAAERSSARPQVQFDLATMFGAAKAADDNDQ